MRAACSPPPFLGHTLPSCAAGLHHMDIHSQSEFQTEVGVFHLGQRPVSTGSISVHSSQLLAGPCGLVGCQRQEGPRPALPGAAAAETRQGVHRKLGLPLGGQLAEALPVRTSRLITDGHHVGSSLSSGSRRAVGTVLAAFLWIQDCFRT